MELKKFGKTFKIDFDDTNEIIILNGKAFKIEYKSGWFIKFERKRVLTSDFQLLKNKIIEAVNTGFMDCYFLRVFEKMQNMKM